MAGEITLRIEGFDLFGTLLETLITKVDALMALTQTDLDKLVSDVQGIAAVLGGFIPRVEAELIALQAAADAGEALNFGPLQAAVTEAKGKSAELDAIPTPDVPPLPADVPPGG